MAEFNIESIIKKGVEEAINEPVYEGKSIIEWAAIGMKAPRWISVKNRMPEEIDEYLVVNNGKVGLAMYFDGLWTAPTRKVDITHWMPLPKSPEEK